MAFKNALLSRRVKDDALTWTSLVARGCGDHKHAAPFPREVLDLRLQLKETVCRKRSFWSHASIFQTRFLFLHYLTAHCRQLDNHWNHLGHQKKKKILSSLNSPELPNIKSWRSCWLVAKLCPTLATPWTAVHRAPLSVGFPRQEYWSGLPFSFSSGSSWFRDRTTSPALAGGFFPTVPRGKPSGEIGSQESLVP